MEKCIIKNEFLKAEISLCGAELKGLAGESVEYVWKGDPKYWNRSAPFLFPIVGTLKDKETYINGELFKMGSHGFLRDQVFEVLSQKEDEVILVNVFNEETLAKYPFKYKAIVTYKLIEKSLKTEVEIYNLDLNDLNMKIYDFSRILGILLDNSIDARHKKFYLAYLISQILIAKGIWVI